MSAQSAARHSLLHSLLAPPWHLHSESSGGLCRVLHRSPALTLPRDTWCRPPAAGPLRRCCRGHAARTRRAIMRGAEPLRQGT